MSGRHTHSVHIDASETRSGSLAHRIPASAKLVGLLVFVVAVALTPRYHLGAFAVDAVVLVVVAVGAGIGPGLIARRLLVITPFIVAALILPFIGHGGPQVDFFGVTLSVDGMWAAGNIIAKATLGATASIIVSATTPTPALIAGLGQLRVPAVIVAIVSFMFRYLDLLVDDLARMRLAMVARGHDPRWLWQVRPVASSAGALFVRSYERGERVHQAMAARGFTGTMPALADSTPARNRGLVALIPGVVAWLVLAVSALA